MPGEGLSLLHMSLSKYTGSLSILLVVCPVLPEGARVRLVSLSVLSFWFWTLTEYLNLHTQITSLAIGP